MKTLLCLLDAGRVAGVVALKVREKGLELRFQVSRDAPQPLVRDPMRLDQALEAVDALDPPLREVLAGLPADGEIDPVALR